MTSGLEQQIEEILERLWTAQEQHRPLKPHLAGEQLDFDPEIACAEATARGWMAARADRLELTGPGEARAAGVMRRHRLAERLFDVVGVGEAAMEATACELEHSHILSDEATDRICAFLGHPVTCPHDRPIPRGRCCTSPGRTVRPLVTPLTEAAIGADLRIVFVASRSHRRLDRLCALGVAPGAVVRLHQRAPALVVQRGETEVAIDPDVAADIFVVPS